MLNPERQQELERRLGEFLRKLRRQRNVEYCQKLARDLLAEFTQRERGQPVGEWLLYRNWEKWMDRPQVFIHTARFGSVRHPYGDDDQHGWRLFRVFTWLIVFALSEWPERESSSLSEWEWELVEDKRLCLAIVLLEYLEWRGHDGLKFYWLEDSERGLRRSPNGGAYSEARRNVFASTTMRRALERVERA